MTPKELYPIGTQLITRRLSQAALGSELFGTFAVDSWLQEQDTGNVSKWNKGFCSAERCHVLGNTLLKPVCEWRVTVTAENQKWLSPVPMVGDFVWIENMGMGFEIGAIADNVVFKSAHKSPFADTESGHSVSNFYCSIEDNPKIISRIYPNNQRAPLIEFDEVILPTKGEQR